jgi:hypothetical protein
MSRLWLAINAVVAIAWLGTVLYLALGIALLGNETTLLASRRGADLDKRRELSHRQERVRAQLDWEASAPHLADAVRKLDLPLTAPPPSRLAVLEAR